MNIAYCFNGDWAEYIPIQIHALLTTNPWVENIILVYPFDKVSPDFAIKLDDIIENLYQPDLYKFTPNKPPCFREWAINRKIPTISTYNASTFPKCNVRGRFTQATMYRLLLPTICAGRRVLYLDADTLVVGDIKELYDYPLKQTQIIAGVKDSGIKPTHKYKLGIRDGIYINAGVILFDFSNQAFTNPEPVHKDWLKIAQTRSFSCNDQDIINMTCRHCIATVPSKFNVSSSTSLDLKDARIIHFAGPKQPWVDKLPHSEYWLEATRRYNACHKSIN